MSAQKETSPTGETLDQIIGRRVHQLMWDQQITQTAFASRIGMDQSSVAKRLRGKLGWSANQVAEAASELGVTVGYLFGETENPRQSPDGGTNSAPGGNRNPDPLGVNTRIATVTSLANYRHTASA